MMHIIQCPFDNVLMHMASYIMPQFGFIPWCQENMNMEEWRFIAPPSWYSRPDWKQSIGKTGFCATHEWMIQINSQDISMTTILDLTEIAADCFRKDIVLVAIANEEDAFKFKMRWS